MARPVILIAPHRRELDTVLGRLNSSIVYDAFPDHLSRAGADSLVAWPGSDAVNHLVARADGVMLVGGGDVKPARFGSPEDGEGVDDVRDEFELRLIEECRRRGMPLLTLCRGAQILNVAFGGTLTRVDGHRQATDLSHASHAVMIDEGSRLGDLLGRDLKVNSFHRWAVERPGEGLKVTARAEDGVVEAFEAATDWWALGIQWHAELLDEPSSRTLFGAFVAAVRREG